MFHLRVPIAVEEHHDVRGLQIDAQAARPGAQQEAEEGGVGRVEAVHCVVAIFAAGPAVDAAMGVALDTQRNPNDSG